MVSVAHWSSLLNWHISSRQGAWKKNFLKCLRCAEHKWPRYSGVSAKTLNPLARYFKHFDYTNSTKINEKVFYYFKLF